MTAPWRCDTCGAPGVRNVFAKGYCAAHLVELFRLFQPETWMQAGGGIGLPEQMRPDHGEGFAELTCSACGASWVGAIFSRCPWCVETIERLVQWQTEQLLHPELPGVDEQRYGAAIEAWAGRLARGVEAGLITERDARRAFDRETGRRRAA